MVNTDTSRWENTTSRLAWRATIDAVQDHRERAGIDLDARSLAGNWRHLEGSSLEPFVVDRVAAGLEQEDLATGPRAVEEREQVARERVCLQRTAHHAGETVEAEVEVHGVRGDKHPATRRDQHERANSSSRASVASAKSSPTVMVRSLTATE